MEAGGGMNGATVKVYSKAKDGGTALTPHFKVREFACSDGSDTIFISPDLVTTLEQIRKHFGAPVIINSGYRTETYNKKIGGATYSQHKYGTAADIVVKGVTPAEVAKYAETILVGVGGIGIYNSFTHIDVRKIKSRWKG